jgi:hypothetical protein
MRREYLSSSWGMSCISSRDRWWASDGDLALGGLGRMSGVASESRVIWNLLYTADLLYKDLRRVSWPGCFGEGLFVGSTLK